MSISCFTAADSRRRGSNRKAGVSAILVPPLVSMDVIVVVAEAGSGVSRTTIDTKDTKNKKTETKVAAKLVSAVSGR